MYTYITQFQQTVCKMKKIYQITQPKLFNSSCLLVILVRIGFTVDSHLILFYLFFEIKLRQ